jgi:hypothetical protein
VGKVPQYCKQKLDIYYLEEFPIWFFSRGNQSDFMIVEGVNQADKPERAGQVEHRADQVQNRADRVERRADPSSKQGRSS